MGDVKFEDPCCPECGEPADYRLERVYVACELVFNEDEQDFDFAGYSDPAWDTQEVVRTDDDLHILTCNSCNREWETACLEDIYGSVTKRNEADDEC